MRNVRLGRCPGYLCFLLAIASGCQAFHQYRPVVVLARDAETKQPIQGAEVFISYPLTPSSCAPWNSSGATGADGIVRLRAAPNEEGGIRIEGTAPGYLSEAKELPDEVVKKLKPARLFVAEDARPVSFALELYAEPRPIVELVVPTGYQGMVKVEVQVQEDAVCPPGQRCFTCVVPPSGVVQVTGPPLLRHIWRLDFRAKYADGTALPQDAKDAELGFWWFKQEGNYDCFMVGSRRQFDNLCRDEQRDGAIKQTRGSGDSGRRGRRGRQAPSDANPE